MCRQWAKLKKATGLEQWVVVAVLAANYWVSEAAGHRNGRRAPLGNSVKEVVGVSGTTGGGQLKLGSAQEFK